jgi:hypothetical protein
MSIPFAVTVSLTVSALRPGQPDDHESRRDDRKQPDYPTDPAASAARDVARETDIGIFDGSYRSPPSSPQNDEWQQGQCPKPVGLKKPNHATGASPVSSTKRRALRKSDSISVTASESPANLTKSHCCKKFRKQ